MKSRSRDGLAAKGLFLWNYECKEMRGIGMKSSACLLILLARRESQPHYSLSQLCHQLCTKYLNFGYRESALKPKMRQVSPGLPPCNIIGRNLNWSRNFVTRLPQIKGREARWPHG